MPSNPTAAPTDIDPDLVHAAAVLRERAASLRAQAPSLPEVLASTYRRRASELELEAWVAQLQSGVPVEQVRSAA
jgi:hypothetical protein